MTGTATVRNRRTLRSLRSHLWLTAALGTLAFASVIALSIFAPILADIDRTDADDPEALGLVRHFVFLYRSFWPLVLVSLLASLAAATVLFQRMRAPLVRHVRAYEAIAEGVVPAQLPIRAWDYLSEETDALNSMIASLRRQQALRMQAAARIEEVIGDLAMRGTPESVLAELQDVAKRLAIAPRERRPDDVEG